MTLATQTRRVLRALERNPERGVTAVDFQLPDVIDGGKPITRLAARVQDLQDAGYRITAGERRQKCVVYRLVPAGAASELDKPGGPLPPSAAVVPASPRPALGSFHCCDCCGEVFTASWPRECPECHAGVIWLASFHDEVQAHRYRPKAVRVERKDIAA